MFDRNDMSIVDMNSVAGIQPVSNLLAIVAGQYSGLSPNREPILVKELPSATMKSNMPPTSRWAIGGGVVLGNAVEAKTRGGAAVRETAGVAVRLGSTQRDSRGPVAVSAYNKDATKIA
jgi:hypothetical protein